jgi:hypothetical protein
MNSSTISKFMKIAAFIVIGVLTIGLVVMWLWNWLVPELLGAPTIGFFQALGLLTLCKILFGSTGSSGHRRGRSNGKYLRKKLASKISRMSEKERQELKDQLRGYDADALERLNTMF